MRAEVSAMAEEALAKAMAPALPRLDVGYLQKALTVAKSSSNVDAKVIAKPEAKLEQASRSALPLLAPAYAYPAPTYIQRAGSADG